MPAIKLEQIIRNVRPEVIVPSARIKADLLEYARVNSFRRFPFFALRYAVGISAVVLMSGAGTVFASQLAIPGQPLYGLKRASETAYINIQPNSEAKAQANEMLIGRRISEASQGADADADSNNAGDIDSQLAVDTELAFEAADASDAWIDAQEDAFSLAIGRE